MDKYVVLVVLVLILIATVPRTSEARRKGSRNCAHKVGRGAGCNSNVSFFKRLLEEESRRSGVKSDLSTVQFERDTSEETMESRIRLLMELISELEPENVDETNL